MIYLIFLVLAAVLIDTRILARFYVVVYQKVFKGFFRILGLLSVLCMVMSFFAEDKDFIIYAYFMFFVGPLYLARRKQFVHHMGEGWTKYSREVIASNACEVAIAWMLSMFYVYEALNILTEVAPHFFAEIEIIMVSSIVSSIIALIIIYKASFDLGEKGFFSRLGVRKTRAPLPVVSLVAIAYGVTFAMISAWILTSREIQPDTSFGDMLENVNTSPGFFLFMISAMILAPFVEEIIFRGYFFSVLRKVKGKWFAVIAITLAFSFMHVDQYWGDALAIAMVTLLGLVMTLLRVFSGSVIPSMFMHYAYNIGVVFFSAVMVTIQNPAYFELIMNYDHYSLGKKITLLQENIAQKPSFTDAHNMLAILYMEANELEKALSTIEDALAVYPNRHFYLDTKASILLKLGREEEAYIIRDKLKISNPRYEIGAYQSELEGL